MKVNQIKAQKKIHIIVGHNLMVKIKRMPGIEEINLIIYCLKLNIIIKNYVNNFPYYLNNFPYYLIFIKNKIKLV